MRQPDLSPFIQILLVSLLTTLVLLVLIRAVSFIRHEYAGTPRRYPAAWSAAQRRTLENLRPLIGVALTPLWGAFLFLAPSMPTSWPFGFGQTACLIVLLLLSNAWILLLKLRNWERAFYRSFALTISFLVIWWASVFGAAGWLIAAASQPSPQLRLPVGVYAAATTAILAEQAP